MTEDSSSNLAGILYAVAIAIVLWAVIFASHPVVVPGMPARAPDPPWPTIMRGTYIIMPEDLDTGK